MARKKVEKPVEIIKKAGRPKKDVSSVRNVQISFSLTKDEADVFYSKIANNGGSIPNLICSLLNIKVV
jgi:hypothetical protein